MIKWQGPDHHFLGVVIEAESGKKQYIVLVLRPDLPSTMQNSPTSSNIQDGRFGDFQQGSFVLPKSKRPAADEYESTFTTRKRSGPIKITLPHQGVAAGSTYEVRRVEIKDFRCICKGKIKVDQVRLLEDCNPGAYSKTVQQLSGLKHGGNNQLEALDPVRGTVSSSFKLKSFGCLNSCLLLWNL